MSCEPTGKRIEAIHSIRGLAALLVTCFHMVNGNLAAPVLSRMFAYGYLGVEMFFVISGFILPYSLWKVGYRVDGRAYGRFLWKRIVRLEPPYLTAVALCAGLAYLSSLAPAYQGKPYRFDPVQLGLHLGYLNGLSGVEWLNPAFWTLAIEFQFYVAIAVLFPFCVEADWVRRRGLHAGFLLLAGLVDPPVLLPHYLPIFGMGIATFQRFAGVVSSREAGVLLGLYSVMTYWQFDFATWAAAAVTSGAILAAPSATHPMLAWLGTISYSLYLVHIPIGGRVINLAGRFSPGTAEAILAFLAAMAASLAAAQFLYWYVERPAQRMASGLRLMPHDREAARRAYSLTRKQLFM